MATGKFKVTLKLPKAFTVHQAEQEISVADRGCGAVNYYITENGAVSGRVFDSDAEPVPGIWLSLVDPDSTIKGYIGQVFAVQGGPSGPKSPNGAPPIPIVSSVPQPIAIERATQTIKLVVPERSNG